MTYNVILADPPWMTRPWGKQGKATRQPPYKTMTDNELMALPVQDLAAPDSALFMWVLDHKLDFALTLGQAWGFKLISVGFYWFKRTPLDNGWNFGTGYGTRAGAVEQCWLFAKGKGLKRADKGVRRLYDDILIEPVKDHSRKPDEIRRRIEKLYGPQPRVELFARRAAPGWDAWGNEIDSAPAAVAVLGQPIRPDPPPQVDLSDYWTNGYSRDVKLAMMRGDDND